MSSNLPAEISAKTSSLILPPAIAEMGGDASRAFIEYFTAAVRNPNTRSAYARAQATWPFRGLPTPRLVRSPF